ncbi:MAG TPA: ice-binding family protein [Jatrophihabitantaceae bacterium]|nr:ice-binding family protein [Jatrophihabitantaceae bacterium]
MTSSLALAKLLPPLLNRVRLSAIAVIAAAVVLLLAAMLAMPAVSHAATATVGLGTAGPYSVLGGQTVTNTGPTSLAGDLGVDPGTAITGFPPGIVAGATHAGDAAALQAQSDVTIAYDDAAGRAPTADVAGDLVGKTLLPGVYKSTSTLALTGTVTLDAHGDPNAVFIFQIASGLTTFTASDVALVNGADACNVFWQVGSSAVLGTAATFNGTILALTSISVNTGTTVHGRALARNGAVTLDTNTFTSPACDTAVAAAAAAAFSSAAAASSAAVAASSSSAAAAASSRAAALASAAASTAGSAPVLATTGLSPAVGRLLGLGALLLILGGLLLAFDSRHARKHPQP